MVRLVGLALRLLAVVAMLLPVVSSNAGAGAPTPFPQMNISSPGVSGPAAVSALGANLPAVAAYYGKTAEQLRQELLRDNGLRVGKTGRLYHVSPAARAGVKARSAAAAAQFRMGAASSLAVPLSQTFQLHSNPGAAKTIYLNFVGRTLTYLDSDFVFETAQTAIAVPPFSTDSNVSFSDAERSIIQEIWQRVSEDFAPFDVDVTTEPPAPEKLSRKDADDLNFGIEIVFAPGGAPWTCGCAALSALDAFFQAGSDYNKPVIVFHAGNSIRAQLLADASSHELGITMGLAIDGYPGMKDAVAYPGQGDSPVNGWVPIMGDLSGRPLSQFSKGEYNNATNQQDDFQVIINNGLPLRADEAGDTRETAASLAVESSNGRSNVSFDGVITSGADKDVYSIKAAAGLLEITANPASVGANADLVLTLLDDTGRVLQTSNRPQDLSASVSQQITAPGIYYLKVEGTGEGDPRTTGYSSYGSVGAYKLTGSFATPSNSPPSASFTAVTGSKPLTVTLDASASGDDGKIVSYNWDFDDQTPGPNSPGPFDKTYASPGTYDVTLVVTDDTGLTSSASRKVEIVSTSKLPEANFSLSVTSGFAPLSVTFTPAASTGDGQNMSFDWDFGDGTTKSETTRTPVNHSYILERPFTATLRVTDNDTKLTSTSSVVITVKEDKPPVSSFAASATRVTTSLPVTFDPAASTDDVGIRSYNWDFGDGTSLPDAGPTPVSKSYASPGDHTVTLTVIDTKGFSALSHRVITVVSPVPPPTPPVAAFTSSVTSGIAPLGVTFDASSSTYVGQTARFDWDFGDGTTRSETSGGSFTKTYATAGSYTVTLRLTAEGDLTSTATQIITVAAAPVVNVPRVASMSMTLVPRTRGRVVARGDVQVVDAAGRAPKKATVFASVTGPKSFVRRAATKRNGVASFTTPASPRGCYRLTVTSFKIGAVTYTPSTPTFAEACP